MAKINMGKLPKEQKPPIEAGEHTLLIKEATAKRSDNKGSIMIVTVNKIITDDGESNFTTNDYLALFDKDGNDIDFGQYKLGRLLEATKTSFEGDLKPSEIAALLEGKTYKARLDEEEFQGKKQLKIKDPDTMQPSDYKPAGNDGLPDIDSDDETVDKDVAAAIEDDDDI